MCLTLPEDYVLLKGSYYSSFFIVAPALSAMPETKIFIELRENLRYDKPFLCTVEMVFNEM